MCLKKRTLAVVLVIVVAMSCIMAFPFSASAATFTPRFTAPENDNKYYFDGNYNIFEDAGYGMPNCTAYAYGRAYEILGTEPNLSWAGAGQWYNDNIAMGAYDYGQTPKVGAIACWNYDGGGHVAVVEEIDDDGNMTLSNSAYNRWDLFFYLTYAHVSDWNPGGSSHWNFQGYIYLLDSDNTGNSEDKPSETQPSETNSDENYKTGIYETSSTNYLNMRASASLYSDVIDGIVDGVELTITEVKSDGDLTWGKTVYNGNTGWVALKYCTFIREYSEEKGNDSTEPQPTNPTPTHPQPTNTQQTEPVSSYSEGIYMTDVEDYLNMRSEASIYSYVVDEISDGIELSISEVKENDEYLWGKTVYNGHTGWVALNHCTFLRENVLLGDVNANGKVEIGDVTALQRHLAGLQKDINIDAADLDSDGVVSINDATLLQRKLAEF